MVKFISFSFIILSLMFVFNSNAQASTPCGFNGTTSGTDSGNNNFMIGMNVCTPVVNSTIDSCVISIASGSGHVLCTLYELSGGTLPVELCHSSSTVVVVSDLVVVPSTCPTLIAGHTYTVAWNNDSSGIVYNRDGSQSASGCGTTPYVSVTAGAATYPAMPSAGTAINAISVCNYKTWLNLSPAAGIALAQHVSAASSGGGTVTSSASDFTNVKLIKLCRTAYAGITDDSVSSSPSNTWVPLTTYTDTVDVALQCWYAINPTVSSSMTFTITTSGSGPAFVALGFTGTSSSPLDQQNGSNGAVTTITSFQPGSITPSQINSLVTSCFGFDTALTASVSGVTLVEQRNYSTGNNFGIACGYIIQSSISAINPTWSTSGVAAVVAADNVSWKPSLSGGSCSGGMLFRGVGGC